jgi:hypothetical protein
VYDRGQVAWHTCCQQFERGERYFSVDFGWAGIIDLDCAQVEPRDFKIVSVWKVR